MIGQEKGYGGAARKVQRLGLAGAVDEVRQVLAGVAAGDLALDAPSAHERWERVEQAVRDAVGQRPQWSAGPMPGTWLRTIDHGQAQVAVGLAVTLAGTTEKRGIWALRRLILEGAIDLGVLVIVGDELGGDPHPPPLLLGRRHGIEAAMEGLPLLALRFCPA